VETLNQFSEVDGEKWVRPADHQRAGALLHRKDELLLGTAVSYVHAASPVDERV
jgi:hypothetical protein